MYCIHENRILHFIIIDVRSCETWLLGFSCGILWILSLEHLFCCMILWIFHLQSLFFMRSWRSWILYLCFTVGSWRSWILIPYFPLGSWGPWGVVFALSWDPGSSLKVILSWDPVDIESSNFVLPLDSVDPESWLLAAVHVWIQIWI